MEVNVHGARDSARPWTLTASAARPRSPSLNAEVREPRGGGRRSCPRAARVPARRPPARRAAPVTRLEVPAPEIPAAEVPAAEVPAAHVEVATADVELAAAEVVAVGHGHAPTATQSAPQQRPHGQARQQPAAEAAEEAAGERRVHRPRIPVGHALAADHDLAGLGVLAALDALGVGLAGRHDARGAAGRGPLDVAVRRAVARVEEAWRAALGRRLAVEHRLGHRHLVAALLQRGRDRLEVLGAPGPLPRRVRAVVGVNRPAVGLLRLPRRELDVEVQRTDVLAQGDEVVARVLLDLRELRRLLPAAPASPDQQRAAADRAGAEQEQRGGAASVAVGTGRIAARVTARRAGRIPPVAEFSHTVALPAPPEEAFPWLLEADRVPRWTGGLESYQQLTPGPLGA